MQAQTTLSSGVGITKHWKTRTTEFVVLEPISNNKLQIKKHYNFKQQTVNQVPCISLFFIIHKILHEPFWNHVNNSVVLTIMSCQHIKGILQNTSSYVSSLRTTDFEESNWKNNIVAKMQEALNTRLRTFISSRKVLQSHSEKTEWTWLCPKITDMVPQRVAAEEEKPGGCCCGHGNMTIKA